MRNCVVSVMVFGFIIIPIFGQVMVEFTPDLPVYTVLDREFDPAIGQRTPALYSHVTYSDSAEFVRDGGIAAGAFTWLAYGDIEAIRYSTQHPCSLFELSFYIGGYGSFEIHLLEY